MEATLILQILVLAVGFYMAWNIGANDVSNAMGTSVGSGALKLRKAVLCAAVLEFCGAFFVGSHVSETMQQGILHLDVFRGDALTLVLGMCASLLGTSVWLQIASYFGWPVSTTHAIVGAICGFGFVYGGVEAIQWKGIGSITSSWVLSPVLSAIVAYMLFSVLQRKVLFAMNPQEAAKKLIPYLTAVVFGIFTLSLVFNGLDHLNLFFTFPQAVAVALGMGLFSFILSYFGIRLSKDKEEAPLCLHTPQNVISLEKAMKHLQRVRISCPDGTKEKVSFLLTEVQELSIHMRQETSLVEPTSEYRVVEKMFSYLQILSACFVAFSHGANDVANAIGPVAAVLDTLKNGVIAHKATVPSWLLFFGGCGIVLGLATWGWRVIETVGKRITELTPTRGFCAEFGAATTILIASKCGLPISTTHCLVGAVLGVGLARGLTALNLGTLRDIILSWVVTIPASAAMSVLIFYALKWLFN